MDTNQEIASVEILSSNQNNNEIEKEDTIVIQINCTTSAHT